MMICSLIVSLSILFTKLSHPLSAGIVLLIQTTLIALSAGLFSKLFWFSYILFLIFLGGMLVLFIYVASLAPNEPFKLSPTLAATIMTAFMTMAVITLATDPVFITNFVPTSAMNYFHNYQPSSNLFIFQIYNLPAAYMTIFVILYLLLTLMVVVKITSTFFGALRTSK